MAKYNTLITDGDGSLGSGKAPKLKRNTCTVPILQRTLRSLKIK